MFFHTILQIRQSSQRARGIVANAREKNVSLPLRHLLTPRPAGTDVCAP
jgi:hypothetical protein